MQRLLALVTSVAAMACGEATIALTLAPSTDLVAGTFDTSCVSAVALQLDGETYDTNPTDAERECLDLTPAERAMTFPALRAAIAGRFKLALPESGLSAVELHGLRGTCNLEGPLQADLVFYGASRYVDEDVVRLPVDANLSCARGSTTVRLLDVKKLRAPADCATAALASAQRVALSTIRPLPFTLNNTGVDWWGGLDQGEVVDGVATFDAATGISTSSCLVASWLDANGRFVSAGCISPESQNVCANAGVREAPAVETSTWNDAVDPTKLTAYRGMIVGLAFDRATGPVAGAVVALGDEDLADRRGEVVYLRRDADTDAIEPATDQRATGPSGLFAIYTRSLLDVTITRGNTIVVRRVGTVGADPKTNVTHTAALIVKL